jgi:hypothetical protein
LSNSILIGAANFPIDALDVIGQNYPGCAMANRNGDLEWVSLRLIRDWANECQAGSDVVDARAQHERRAPPRLFATGLGIEG